jgi:hypothetical protein
LAPPLTDPLLQCLEGATSVESDLAPGSFAADGAAKTLQWTEVVSAPVSCANVGSNSISMTVQYSLTEE